jgi:hypothetical protein
MFGKGNMNFFGPPVSKNKLAEMMVQILIQLPKGTSNLKGNVVMNLGAVGQTCTTRYINDAWNTAKKIAARDYPDLFILGNKDALCWKDEDAKPMDKKISPSNYRKLNKLAEDESLSVNELITLLIREHEKQK